MTNANESPVIMIVPIIRRADLDLETFRAYWREVHGSAAARLPGLDFYEQLHLGPSPVCHGAATPYTDEEIDGFAILGFRSNADLDEYRTAASITQEDEPNAFRFAARYDVPYRPDGLQCLSRDEARSFSWREGALLVLRRIPEASDHDFESSVLTLCESLKASSGVADVRVSFPLPRTEEASPAGTVDRFTPLPRQIQAIARLAFSDEAASPPLVPHLAGQEAIASAQLYDIAASHLYVMDGAMTVSALRGVQAAGLIARMGAKNQLEPKVITLFSSGARATDIDLF
jgi:hypothetical protein